MQIGLTLSFHLGHLTLGEEQHINYGIREDVSDKGSSTFFQTLELYKLFPVHFPAAYSSSVLAS